MSLKGLFRAPHHIGTEKLKSIVDGRTVALVGNASSLFQKNQGPEIDVHDVIIRLNRGFIIDAKKQGSRTDVAGTARPLKVEQVENYNPKLIYWLFWRLWRLPTWNDAIWDKTEIVPPKDWYSANQKLIGRPTSGFVMFHTLLVHTKPKNLNVFGFDFYASDNFYRGPLLKKSVHSHVAEEEAFRALVAAHRNVKLK